MAHGEVKREQPYCSNNQIQKQNWIFGAFNSLTLQLIVPRKKVIFQNYTLHGEDWQDHFNHHESRSARIIHQHWKIPNAIKTKHRIIWTAKHKASFPAFTNFISLFKNQSFFLLRFKSRKISDFQTQPLAWEIKNNFLRRIHATNPQNKKDQATKE